MCVKCFFDFGDSSRVKCGQPHACAEHVCAQAGCTKLQVVASSSRFCADHVCTECVGTSGPGNKGNYLNHLDYICV